MTENPENKPFVTKGSLYLIREGERTVGSGRVAIIVEQIVRVYGVFWKIEGISFKILQQQKSVKRCKNGAIKFVGEGLNMDNCLVCERIALIKENKNPYFVRELNTGYVVIGDQQRIKGYTLFLCKQHVYELHQLESGYRDEFLHEMAVVAEAVYNAFQPDKLNYSLLGVGRGLHMHWHIHPRRNGDTPIPGPVYQLGQELTDKKYNPTNEELELLKTKLNKELDKLL